MKKTIPYIIASILSILITFVFFNAMSWYNFGDIPTSTVLIRLIVFFVILFAVLSFIVLLITKKK